MADSPKKWPILLKMANSVESARGFGHFKIATFSRLSGAVNTFFVNQHKLNDPMMPLVLFMTVPSKPMLLTNSLVSREKSGGKREIKPC